MRVMDKCGFKKEGILRESVVRFGEVVMRFCMGLRGRTGKRGRINNLKSGLFGFL